MHDALLRFMKISALNPDETNDPFSNWVPDYPRHPSRSGLGSARVPGPARGRDGIGGRVAARGAGPERGRVSGALRDRGGVPRGAVRDALAGGADLPGLRPPRLLRAQDPQGLPVQPVQEAAL